MKNKNKKIRKLNFKMQPDYSDIKSKLYVEALIEKEKLVEESRKEMAGKKFIKVGIDRDSNIFIILENESNEQTEYELEINLGELVIATLATSFYKVQILPLAGDAFDFAEKLLGSYEKSEKISDIYISLINNSVKGYLRGVEILSTNNKIMDAKKFTDFIEYEFKLIAIASLSTSGLELLEQYNIITKNEGDEELEILLSHLGRIESYEEISNNRYYFTTKDKIKL